MTFPVVAASNTNKRAPSGSAFSVNLPTGITAGDRLLIILAYMLSPSTPSGWTQIFSNSAGSGSLFVYEKKSASGSEGSSVSVGGTGGAVAISYRITGSDTSAATEISTVTTGNINTNPDSGSLTPSWGALDTLWFSAAQDQNASATTTSYPSSYSGNQTSSLQSGVGALRNASRNLNATSDNPGAYTLSSTSTGGWQAITLAVKPGSAAVSYTLTAATGSFALSGVAATLRAARTFAASVGARTLTGVNANLVHGYTLTAAQGTFALAGVAAGLRTARTLPAATGAVSLAGVAARLARGLRFSAALGNVVLTGNAAALRAARTLPASVGTFSLAGVAAALRRDLRLSTAVGAVVLTGVAAGLRAARVLPAGTGAFALTGYAAGLNVSGSFSLAAGTGAFVLAGNGAEFTIGAVAPSQARGDDAPRNRRRVFVYPEAPPLAAVAEPADRVTKRVTPALIIEAARTLPDALAAVLPRSPALAAALPTHVEMPRLGPDVQAELMLRIVSAFLDAEARRLAAAADEDDIELLLLAA